MSSGFCELLHLLCVSLGCSGVCLFRFTLLLKCYMQTHNARVCTVGSIADALYTPVVPAPSTRHRVAAPRRDGARPWGSGSPLFVLHAGAPEGGVDEPQGTGAASCSLTVLRNITPAECMDLCSVKVFQPFFVKCCLSPQWPFQVYV